MILRWLLKQEIIIVREYKTLTGHADLAKFDLVEIEEILVENT